MSTTAFHSRARGSSDVYDPTRVCCSICLRILRYTAAMLPFGAPCHAVMAYSHYWPHIRGAGLPRKYRLPGAITCALCGAVVTCDMHSELLLMLAYINRLSYASTRRFVLSVFFC